MIRARGAAAVGERLSELADAIRRNLTAAVAAEAAALASEAKRRCPVETGTLKASIRAAVETRDAEADAAVGTDLAYAPAVELGTLARPPQPFLAPALRAREGAVTEHMKQAVRSAVKGDAE